MLRNITQVGQNHFKCGRGAGVWSDWDISTTEFALVLPAAGATRSSDALCSPCPAGFFSRASGQPLTHSSSKLGLNILAQQEWCIPHHPPFCTPSISRQSIDAGKLHVYILVLRRLKSWSCEPSFQPATVVENYEGPAWSRSPTSVGYFASGRPKWDNPGK
jgi:hypothetical protein